MIKDAEKQMELRGVMSDKQILITLLEQTYMTAKSEQDFYQLLTLQNLDLYSRNNIVVGVKMSRKFRFRTLGYTREILYDLEKSQKIEHRLKHLQEIQRGQRKRSRNKDR